jgi:hypothetical protein
MPEPIEGPGSNDAPPFRRVALYTAGLTPRFELPEDLRTVFQAILEHAPEERKVIEDVYPWFFRLTAIDRAAFVDYCEELDCLHEDLDFAVFDLETALDFSYRDEFYWQRLALVYHVDNVDFRVHAYREKLFRLLDCFLGRDERRQDRPGGDFHSRVLDSLAQQGELSSEVVDERERRRTLLGEVEQSTPKPRWQPGERYATHVGGYHHEGGGAGR